jgi:hypothetical protein
MMETQYLVEDQQISRLVVVKTFSSDWALVLTAYYILTNLNREVPLLFFETSLLFVRKKYFGTECDFSLSDAD